MGVKDITRKSIETAHLSLWELRDSEKIRSQHVTDLSPLHLGDSCAAWSLVEPLAMGQGFVDNVLTVSLQLIPYDEMPFSGFMQGEELGVVST